MCILTLIILKLTYSSKLSKVAFGRIFICSFPVPISLKFYWKEFGSVWALLNVQEDFLEPKIHFWSSELENKKKSFSIWTDRVVLW